MHIILPLAACSARATIQYFLLRMLSSFVYNVLNWLFLALTVLLNQFTH